MRKKIYFIIPGMIIAFIFLSAFMGYSPEHSNGAPAGYTGSPGDGHNCTSCHGGTATTVSGLITSDIPAQGYTANTTYSITATVTGSGGKGFEVSPQDAPGNLLGTLAAGSGSKLVGSGKYVTHNAPVGGSTATWVFSWTAPASGTGTVTFYGAFAITENTTRLSTLVVNEAAPLSATATATPGTICTGQTSQLNVLPTGGSGSYTYAWTSLPAGFTSTLQDPIVSPTQFTQYIAFVSDGSSSVSDTAQVDITPAPVVTAGGDTIYCVNITQVPLNGTATGYQTVTWSTSGDGTFSNTSTLVSIYYPGAGDKSSGLVALTLTASPLSPCSNDVSDSRNIYFVPCNGIRDQDSGLTFTLWPNPNQGIFTISGIPAKNETAILMILDLQGNTLRKENLLFTVNQTDYRVDLSSLPKGVYFLRILSDSGSKTEKLILQ